MTAVALSVMLCVWLSFRAGYRAGLAAPGDATPIASVTPVESLTSPSLPATATPVDVESLRLVATTLLRQNGQQISTAIIEITATGKQGAYAVGGAIEGQPLRIESIADDSVTLLTDDGQRIKLSISERRSESTAQKLAEAEDEPNPVTTAKARELKTRAQSRSSRKSPAVVAWRSAIESRAGSVQVNEDDAENVVAEELEEFYADIAKAAGESAESESAGP